MAIGIGCNAHTHHTHIRLRVSIIFICRHLWQSDCVLVCVICAASIHSFIHAADVFVCMKCFQCCKCNFHLPVTKISFYSLHLFRSVCVGRSFQFLLSICLRICHVLRHLSFFVCMCATTAYTHKCHIELTMNSQRWNENSSILTGHIHRTHLCCTWEFRGL